MDWLAGDCGDESHLQAILLRPFRQVKPTGDPVRRQSGHPKSHPDRRTDNWADEFHPPKFMKKKRLDKELLYGI